MKLSWELVLVIEKSCLRLVSGASGCGRRPFASAYFAPLNPPLVEVCSSRKEREVRNEARDDDTDGFGGGSANGVSGPRGAGKWNQRPGASVNGASRRYPFGAYTRRPGRCQRHRPIREWNPAGVGSPHPALGLWPLPG